MSENFRPPAADEVIVIDNKATEQFRNLIVRLTDFFNATVPNDLSYYTYYADLAAIDSILKQPKSGMTVMVTGQGIAVFNNNNDWVLASDDTTLIT